MRESTMTRTPLGDNYGCETSHPSNETDSSLTVIEVVFELTRPMSFQGKQSARNSREPDTSFLLNLAPPELERFVQREYFVSMHMKRTGV